MSSTEKQKIELVGGICDGYMVSIPANTKLFFVSYSILGEYVSEPKKGKDYQTAHYEVFEDGKARPHKIEDEEV